eukprot:COSAG06_NODE_34003_length_481_cov_0.801047_1_plen_42_part_10
MQHALPRRDRQLGQQSSDRSANAVAAKTYREKRKSAGLKTGQ